MLVATHFNPRGPTARRNGWWQKGMRQVCFGGRNKTRLLAKLRLRKMEPDTRNVQTSRALIYSIHQHPEHPGSSSAHNTMSALHAFGAGRAFHALLAQQTASLLLGLIALWLLYPHSFERDAKGRKEPGRAQFKKRKNRKKH
jgi:hypothetical protein